MPSAREKVTTRLLSIGLEQWNHPWRLVLAIPVFWIVGHAIGFLGGVHLVPSGVPDPVVAALFGGAGIAVGSAALAVID